ncbi:MAG: hypothetical protein K2H33_03945 [Muribaculaceae bacterium]|nr:hypothetical protein [Muribaculaceae bacterium]
MNMIRSILSALLLMAIAMEISAEKRLYVHALGNVYNYPVAGTEVKTVDFNGVPYISISSSTSSFSEVLMDAAYVQSVNVGESGSVADDRAALMALYRNMTINDPFAFEGWGTDKPLSEWGRVVTDPETGRVKTLWLNAVCLVHELPEEMSNLTELTSLYIYTDHPEEAGILARLQSLQVLSFYTPEENKTLDRIPDWLCNLGDLTFLQIEVNPQQWYDFEIERLRCLHYLRIQGCAQQDSPLGFPDFIKKAKLSELMLNGLNLGCEIPDWLYGMSQLTSIELDECNLTGPISKSISILENLEYISMSRNQLNGMLPSEICDLKKLQGLSLRDNQFEGYVPIGFGGLTKLTSLELARNNLDGVLPSDFVQNPNYRYWNVDQQILPQNAGYHLTLPGEAYISKDYSSDGKVTVLQTSKYGKGYDVILMGDGYTDRDVKDGLYDRHMREAFENIFLLEPMKSYRDYVNVSYVTVVSPSNSFVDNNTAFKAVFFNGYENQFTTCDMAKVNQYADKADRRNLDYYTIGVVLNTNITSGTCHPHGIGKATAIMGHAVPGDKYFSKSFAASVNHELVGHAIGQLKDEYYYTSRFDSAEAQEAHDYGVLNNVNANVDFFSDPTKIRWNHMLNDPQFSSYTGIYEGGMLYKYGVWRPEDQSIMNTLIPYFNAPSREGIVRILKAACGLEYDYQEFKELDKYEPTPFPNAGWDPQY